MIDVGANTNDFSFQKSDYSESKSELDSMCSTAATKKIWTKAKVHTFWNVAMQKKIFTQQSTTQIKVSSIFQ